LFEATKGFCERELLGKGGFGKVYRGVLPGSNVQVGVKRIFHNSKQGMKEFVAEINWHHWSAATPQLGSSSRLLSRQRGAHSCL